MQNIPTNDAIKSHKGTMFGIPVRDWLTYTNAAYLLSLFLTFALTVTLWRVSVAAQNENDAELEKYKSAAQVEIVQANTQAEAAKRDAAVAYEKTKFLENEVAKANLETAEIQKLVVWRTVSHNDVEVFARHLQGLEVPLAIKVQISDPEAIAYAYILHSVLNDLGLHVGSLSSTNKPFLFGVQLSGPSGEALDRLQAAFTEAGIKVDTAVGETYVLNVGSKLPKMTVPKFQVVP